jgi:class 3 adenylate cyclase
MIRTVATCSCLTVLPCACVNAVVSTEDTRAAVVESHFRAWAEACLVDDVATHVHEVSRLSYEPRTLDERVSPLAGFLRSYQCEEALRGGVKEDILALHGDNKPPAPLVTSSELRNVIVMFINIKMDNSTVYRDPAPKQHIKTCAADEFCFLTRSQTELDADIALRDKFQQCFAVMAETFHEKGGQVRQFIVDDKGTVCIGTFGLRGAVNYDNASAAVETAELILHGLQRLNIGASIGLTSGQAYCGLVGSTLRHEYAVMGPSTNLSARLMCRAALGEAICDAATRTRDRVHAFTTLPAVQAKGYAQLVPTFKPNLNAFAEARNNPQAPNLAISLQSATQSPNVPNSPTKLQMMKNGAYFGASLTRIREYMAAHKLQGRTADIEKVARLLFPTVEGDRFTVEFMAAVDGGGLTSQAKFDITQPTRLVGVVGAHGIGKTSLLDFFQDHSVRLLQSGGHNIQVFRHRVGYINSSSPFSAWMCMVIHEMFYVAQWWYANNATEETRNYTVSFNDIGKGLEYICSQLDPDMQALMPLLCDIGLHPPLPDTEATAPLKGTRRLYRTGDLLAAIIQQFPKITGKLAVMIM